MKLLYTFDQENDERFGYLNVCFPTCFRPVCTCTSYIFGWCLVHVGMFFSGRASQSFPDDKKHVYIVIYTCIVNECL